MPERQFPEGTRVDDLDLSGVHLHGTNLEGARLTETYLMGADISGDIEGLRLNGVEVEPLVRAQLDRLYPERLKLRATDVAGLRDAWSMVEKLWAATSERALALPEAVQRQGVCGEWSIVETLRHLIFATDCWLFRAVKLEPSPYHPWGLPWSGAGPQFGHAVGVDIAASPGLAEVLPVRREHQKAVREMLDDITDSELAEIRTSPRSPGHPEGDHSVLQCIHVILNEEWEHHRYTVRDLDRISLVEGGDQAPKATAR
ncbi:MAG: DinB family protein [Actinomycetota bacterium]|nr:DinB family protein [Actinomycetota bacterium]